MKYYIDQEFQEGFHKPLFGKRRHFIDLISIGIVAEDGREYYAISKDFNLKSVWKDDWLRENVLKPIYKEHRWNGVYTAKHPWTSAGGFDFTAMSCLLDCIGKSNEQIAYEIKEFVYTCEIQTKYQNPQLTIDRFIWADRVILQDNPACIDLTTLNSIEFYGYYADYDWVLFCSLFGKMLDLPKGFPMYCRDLKQMFDLKQDQREGLNRMIHNDENMLQLYKTHPQIQPLSLKEHADYPKQLNEHNALADARWIQQLHKFLQSL